MAPPGKHSLHAYLPATEPWHIWEGLDRKRCAPAQPRGRGASRCAATAGGGRRRPPPAPFAAARLRRTPAARQPDPSGPPGAAREYIQARNHYSRHCLALLPRKRTPPHVHASPEYAALKEERSQVLWRGVERVIPDIRQRAELSLVRSTPLYGRRSARPALNERLLIRELDASTCPSLSLPPAPVSAPCWGCAGGRGQLSHSRCQLVRPAPRLSQVGTPLTHSRYLRRHRGSYGPAIKAGEGLFPGACAHPVCARALAPHTACRSTILGADAGGCRIIPLHATSAIHGRRLPPRPKGTHLPSNNPLLPRRRAAGPTTPVKGLYACGDSTFPGIGLPAVAASGAVCANTLAPLGSHLQLLSSLGL